MATKLKNLHLTKVDFVDEGANQRADIRLTKRNNRSRDDPGQAETDQENSRSASILKRFSNWLKREGYSFADVEKAAVSFEQQMNASSTEAITSEIWDVMYALRNSLDSVIYDMELDGEGKKTAMQENLAQFSEAIQSYIPKWCSGKIAGLKKSISAPGEKEIAVIKRDYEALGEVLNMHQKKGDLEDMLKIDKSKMTPEEKAAYDEMIRKYAVEVDEDGKEDLQKAAAKSGTDEDDDDFLEDDEKKKTATAKSVSASTDKPAADGTEALIADLRAEVAKMKDDALTKELSAVAKKYEAIGRKPEELVPTLKSLKAAGGTAYEEMIALLDDLVAAQDASGLFGEIGKSHTGTDAEKSGIAKARAKAAELRKNRPELSAEQALDEVLLGDPELMAEFDK